ALLVGIAVAPDLIDADVRMRAVGETDRGGRARDFLHGDTVLEVAETRAAPFLLDRDAEHAELAELGPEVTREGVAAVDLVGTRRDLVGRKAAHAVAQHVGGLAQAEIEAADVVHAHGWVSVWRAPHKPAVGLPGLMHVLDLTSNIGGRWPI